MHAGQCNVLSPTITSSSDSDVCRVASQGLLSYTCTNNGDSLVWKSSGFGRRGQLGVTASYKKPISYTVNGIHFRATSNGNATCFASVLIITGSLLSLSALNGMELRCDATKQLPTNTTIRVPGDARKQNNYMQHIETLLHDI